MSLMPLARSLEKWVCGQLLLKFCSSDCFTHAVLPVHGSLIRYFLLAPSPRTSLIIMKWPPPAVPPLVAVACQVLPAAGGAMSVSASGRYIQVCSSFLVDVPLGLRV